MPFPLPKGSKMRRESRVKSITQAVILKDLTFEGAVEVGKAIKEPDEGETRVKLAMSLAALVKSWDSACERIRILRMKPMPGSLRPEAPIKKPRRRSPGAPAGPLPALDPEPPAVPENPGNMSESVRQAENPGV